MFDVCVIGHVSKDLVVVGGEATGPRPGGAAYYAAMAFRSLGLNTAVVTKVGREDEEALLGGLRKHGVRVFCSPCEHSTAFENVYPSGALDHRYQRVSALASPFSARDLAPVRAAHVHLGPLTAGEISAPLMRELSRRGARLSLDVQGLVREVSSGEVRAADWPDKAAGLGHVDILKADRDEARVLSGQAEPARAAAELASLGPREVVITLGREGSLIYCEGETHRIPALSPREAVDATGCGDSYIAGYVFHRLRSDEVGRAGRFAAALAACKLGRPGPFTGNERDVEALL